MPNTPINLTVPKGAKAAGLAQIDGLMAAIKDPSSPLSAFAKGFGIDPDDFIASGQKLRDQIAGNKPKSPPDPA